MNKKQLTYFVSFICTQISDENKKPEQVFANMVFKSNKPIREPQDIVNVQTYIQQQLGYKAVILNLVKLD